MTTEAYVAQKTELQIAVASTLTAIPRAFEITPPNLDRADIDFTDLGMDWKEYQKGVKDGGEVTCKVHWDPADAVHAEVMDAYLDEGSVEMAVVFPQAGGFAMSFSANVTKFGPEPTTVDGKLTFMFRAKITGEVTFT